MKNIKLFERELELIVDEELRMVVKAYLLERVPDYFWTDGASSSGKYHPQFAQGEGGLVRHTKAVVMFAEELLRMSSYAYMREEYKDYVIAACILHDTAKYGIGEFDKSEYKNHAANAAKAFADYAEQVMDYKPSEFLLNAIASHMGQWSTEKEDRPFTNIDRCVHMADYMASRSFIDIPSITEEWHEVEMEMVVAGELPF
jgi:HD superfamily phosphohydrolase YqeK